jgi:hypothetical protein
LFFLTLFSKDSLKYVSDGKILKNRTRLDAIMTDAKVTQLDAVDDGTKPSCHLAIEAEVTLTWHEAYAMSCDVKHDAVDLSAMLDAMISRVKRPAILAQSSGRRSTRSWRG